MHALFREIEIVKLLLDGYFVPLEDVLKSIREAQSMEQIGNMLNGIWGDNGKRVVIENSVFKGRTALIEINMVREALGLSPFRQPSFGVGVIRRQPKKWLND
jgi:hypothetical protein